MTRLKPWQTGLALTLLLGCSACVAVPYDDGPPGPPPVYYGDYPTAYPWAGGANVDLVYGYGHGGYYGHYGHYDHGGYGRGGYGRGSYGRGFGGGHGGFGGGHGGGHGGGFHH